MQDVAHHDLVAVRDGEHQDGRRGERQPNAEQGGDTVPPEAGAQRARRQHDEDRGRDQAACQPAPGQAQQALPVAERDDGDHHAGPVVDLVDHQPAPRSAALDHGSRGSDHAADHHGERDQPDGGHGAGNAHRGGNGRGSQIAARVQDETGAEGDRQHRRHDLRGGGRPADDGPAHAQLANAVRGEQDDDHDRERAELGRAHQAGQHQGQGHGAEPRGHRIHEDPADPGRDPGQAGAALVQPGGGQPVRAGRR